MNLHWHRTRLVWFCLPGLVFLLWAWWDSEKNYSEIVMVKPRSFVAVYQSGGRLCLVVTDEVPGPGHLFSGPGLQFHRGVRSMRGIGAGISDIYGSDRAQRETGSRHYFAPGLYRLRWSFENPLGPRPFFPSLRYREWGVEWWLVVTTYGLLFFWGGVWWQCRKARLLKLSTTSPP